MELWEYNLFAEGCEERRKNDIVNCILTGYYGAYYNNNGKKAQKPSELINKLFQKKQSLSEGLEAIKAIKEKEQEHG
ncbi:MAG: hypothetical protein LBQ27_00565 [Clostridiales bacterium]|jgi:hypothetical protein|nr:hypothetical protein [Clostridiales bacterium]